jgi:hypothetical protein
MFLVIYIKKNRISVIMIKKQSIMLNIVKMKINSITLFIIKKITLEINTLIKEDHISGKQN